jgi:hypothetical protein
VRVPCKSAYIQRGQRLKKRAWPSWRVYLTARAAAITGWTRREIEEETHVALILQLLHADQVWNGAETRWPEHAQQAEKSLQDAIRNALED